jgi:hypothetical protein
MSYLRFSVGWTVAGLVSFRSIRVTCAVGVGICSLANTYGHNNSRYNSVYRWLQCSWVAKVNCLPLFSVRGASQFEISGTAISDLSLQGWSASAKGWSCSWDQNQSPWLLVSPIKTGLLRFLMLQGHVSEAFLGKCASRSRHRASVSVTRGQGAWIKTKISYY